MVEAIRPSQYRFATCPPLATLLVSSCVSSDDLQLLEEDGLSLRSTEYSVDGGCSHLERPPTLATGLVRFPVTLVAGTITDPMTLLEVRELTGQISVARPHCYCTMAY